MIVLNGSQIYQRWAVAADLMAVVSTRTWTETGLASFRLAKNLLTLSSILKRTRILSWMRLCLRFKTTKRRMRYSVTRWSTVFSMTSSKVLWKSACPRTYKYIIQPLRSVSLQKNKAEASVVSARQEVKLQLSHQMLSLMEAHRKPASLTKTSWCRHPITFVSKNLRREQTIKTAMQGWTTVTTSHSTLRSFTAKFTRQMRWSSAARSTILSTARSASPSI